MKANNGVDNILSNAKNITQLQKALRAYTFIMSDYGKDKEYGEHNLYVKKTIPTMIKDGIKPAGLIENHKGLLSKVYDESIGMIEHLRRLKSIAKNIPKLNKKLKKAEQKHLINLIKGDKHEG